jgi:hypothetical protein
MDSSDDQERGWQAEITASTDQATVDFLVGMTWVVLRMATMSQSRSAPPGHDDSAKPQGWPVWTEWAKGQTSVAQSDFRPTSTMESQHHGTTAEGRTRFVDGHHPLSEYGDSTLTVSRYLTCSVTESVISRGQPTMMWSRAIDACITFPCVCHVFCVLPS